MTDFIERRGIFIVSFQLEGLCAALRLITQCGVQLGDATVILLQKLQRDFRGLVESGCVVDDVPDVTSGMTTPEMLAIAEVLRASALSFLSADEAEDHRRSIGFAA